jgi:hypothetical protein
MAVSAGRSKKDHERLDTHWVRRMSKPPPSLSPETLYQEYQHLSKEEKHLEAFEKLQEALTAVEDRIKSLSLQFPILFYYLIFLFQSLAIESRGILW